MGNHGPERRQHSGRAIRADCSYSFWGCGWNLAAVSEVTERDTRDTMSETQNTLRRGGELGPRMGKPGLGNRLYSAPDEGQYKHGSGWDESGPQSEQARQHAPHRQGKAKLSAVPQQHTSAPKEPARSSIPLKRVSGRLGDEKPMPEPPVSTAVTNDDMSGKATGHLDMAGNTAARANGPPGPIADDSSIQAEQEPPAAAIGALAATGTAL